MASINEENLWPVNLFESANVSDTFSTSEELMTSPHAKLLSTIEINHLLKPDRNLLDLGESFNISRYHELVTFRQRGEINSSTGDIHYQKHLWRMQRLLSAAHGHVLDVGCGDPLIGASLLNSRVSYVGVDPFPTFTNPYCFRSVAEELPFRDSTFNGVIFNTSLDHVLDYVTALNEAKRVLQPAGSLFLATLLWTDRYSLVNDSVHFHHFKKFEIVGALNYCGFDVASCSWYRYKSDNHRVGLYLHATSK